jgi:hypothetical protein
MSRSEYPKDLTDADELGREFYSEMRATAPFDGPWETLSNKQQRQWTTAAHHVVLKGWAKVDFWMETLTDEQVMGLLQSQPLPQQLRMAAEILVEATRSTGGAGSTDPWSADRLRKRADSLERDERELSEKAELIKLIVTAMGTRTTVDESDTAVRALAGAIMEQGWRKKVTDA